VTLTTAKTSCSVDSAAITSDQAQVNSDENQITQDQSSVKVQTLAVQVDQANTTTSLRALTRQVGHRQDQSTIAQSNVSFVQDREASLKTRRP